MKRAVGISLGSSKRNKAVEITLGGEKISVERIGTDGDVEKAKQLYAELDGKVDAFGVGGVDLYIYINDKTYPLHAAIKMVSHVEKTPLCDGSGLKHTLERRVFELIEPELGYRPHFKNAFVPVAVDREGLGLAVEEVSENVIIGDLMVALGIPIAVHGMKNFYWVARVLMPFISISPMSVLYYGSDGSEHEPKYVKYWEAADLIAGDFLFMRKYMPERVDGKILLTNTTTADNVELVRSRGAKMLITTTPRYDGRSFGTNTTEAILTAYVGEKRKLTRNEINQLINDLNIRPTVQVFDQ